MSTRSHENVSLKRSGFFYFFYDIELFYYGSGIKLMLVARSDAMQDNVLRVTATRCTRSLAVIGSLARILWILETVNERISLTNLWGQTWLSELILFEHFKLKFLVLSPLLDRRQFIMSFRKLNLENFIGAATILSHFYQNFIRIDIFFCIQNKMYL